MIFKFLPTEDKFFTLFQEGAELSVQAAYEMRKLLADLKNSESYARTIKDIEHKSDEVTHRTIELLHKTFITPLDRDDIHKLITKMDDIVDFMDAAAQRIFLYGLTTTTPEATGLAEICIKSVEHLRSAIKGLSNLKDANEIVKNCVEVNRLENEADQLLRSGMAKLFQNESDTRQLIKLKEIYELLETVTDRCEDVANIIEGIVLEYA